MNSEADGAEDGKSDRGILHTSDPRHADKYGESTTEEACSLAFKQ